jgi:hypothetical protein
MARIRTIKPEFWIDEKLAPLEPIHRLVFLGLISQADDDGRLVDNARLLNGLLFPETDDCCRESLEILARLSRVIRYRSESGQKLIQIANWEKHQRVDKPSKHTLPAPPPEALESEGDGGSSGDPRETLARPSREALAPTMDLGPRTMDHGPGTKQPREDFSESDEGDVENSQHGRPSEALDPDEPDGSELPHPGSRMSASELIEIWSSTLEDPVTPDERKSFRGVAMGLTNRHTRNDLLQAMTGMMALFPHCPPKSEPWDLNDLQRKFTKAKAKARDHPEIKAMAEKAAFLQEAGA